jgi:hypothetical protein
MFDDGHLNSKIKQRNNIDSMSMAICFPTYITTNLGERRGKVEYLLKFLYVGTAISMVTGPERITILNKYWIFLYVLLRIFSFLVSFLR